MVQAFTVLLSYSTFPLSIHGCDLVVNEVGRRIVQTLVDRVIQYLCCWEVVSDLRISQCVGKLVRTTAIITNTFSLIANYYVLKAWMCSYVNPN